jgi:hypothetical protein
MSQGPALAPAPESAAAFAPELLEPEVPLAPEPEPELEPELPLELALPVDPEPAVDAELGDPGLEPELPEVPAFDALLPPPAPALGAGLVKLPLEPQALADTVARAMTKSVRVRINSSPFLVETARDPVYEWWSK